jgi:hypothetical protein
MDQVSLAEAPAALLALQKQGLFKLTYLHQGPYGQMWDFSGPAGIEGSITIEEQPGSFLLHTIDIEPSGTGLGAKIVDGCKAHAQQSQTTFRVPQAMNLDFFARFKWLRWQEPGPDNSMWSASYSPA